MGDEKEDEAKNDETRNKILALQSELSRKQEEKERLKQKFTALGDEKKEREENRDRLHERIQFEKRKQADESENRHQINAEDQAVDHFIETEIKTMLGKQVPAFKADEKDDDESDDEQRKDEEGDQQEEGKKVHDSVIVTYLAPSHTEKDKVDEFRCTYRIDKFEKKEPNGEKLAKDSTATTGKQLHSDACEYWGCSKDEFKLCKLKEVTQTSADGKPKPPDLAQLTDEELEKALTDKGILDPAKRANLFLVHQRVWDQRELQKQTTLDIEEVIKAQTRGTQVDDSSLASMQHGSAQAQQQEEHYAVAFQKWPGIYNILRTPPKYKQVKNWHRIKLRDILIYILLIVLTGVGILLRFQTEYYWLRHGVEQAVAIGMPGQTSAPSAGVVNMYDVNQYDDIWRWVRGSFHYQMFNGNSTLLDFYTPVGFMRVRQQKSKKRECRREGLYRNALPANCRYVDTDEEQQQKDLLIVDFSTWLNSSELAEETGRLTERNPRWWYKANDYDAFLTGHLQSNYDGSGYMIDYNLSNPNVGATFLADMNIFRTYWLDSHTRLLSFEVLLANYNIGGFVSSVFMFEIAPSGAVKGTAHLMPINLGNEQMGGTGALVVDIIRSVCVFYILTAQAVSETAFRASIGGSGLEYIFSFVGFLDQSIVATFVSMCIMRLKHDPPAPIDMTRFYSYSVEAIVHQRLYTTEGFFLLLICLRFTTFMKLSTHIDKYWKMLFRSCKMIGFWLFVAAPPFLGSMVLAHCIWSPYSHRFTTWWETFVSLIFFVKQDFDLENMYISQPTWTIPFIVFYYILTSLFLLPGFLAIAVYAYFQVQLLDTNPREPHPWTRDQWMDWILFGFVYQCITRRPPGASKREEGAEEEEDGGDEDEDAEEDE